MKKVPGFQWLRDRVKISSPSVSGIPSLFRVFGNRLWEVICAPSLIWVLIIFVMLGVISTGVITNITLRSVEKQLPKMLLTELNDLSHILENLSDVVLAAAIFRDMPNGNNLDSLRDKIDPVFNGIVTLRESYVIDNLVQASAFHAIVAPAVADLQIWLDEGVSGLAVTDETTAAVVFLRISDAYQKARLVNRESRANAQVKLIEQQKRLGHFITNVNLMLFLTALTGIGMLILLIRQYGLQQSELKSKRKLKVQRDLLTRLFQHVSLGITLWDQNGDLLFVNRGFMEITGYTKEDINNLGDWFAKAYPDPDYRKQVIADWENASGSEAIRQFKVTCKSGQIKEIEVRGTFLDDGRTLVTMSDVTWRVAAEKEKINSHKIVEEHKKLSLVGQVAGKMAHDFNNILGIIMGNAEIGLLKTKEPDMARILNLIFKQTVRGKNLTKNLIAFAKDQELKQTFFQLNTKINLVIDLLKKDLENIDLAFEPSLSLPELLADPGMIEHALVNLIKNAVHALSKTRHPRIRIRTDCRDNRICLEIEDNGCGIPKAQVANIYDPSFTLKGSRDLSQAYAPGIKGTGYGMANVKKYIEQHNGTVSVMSEVGSGTTFTIQLPVVKKTLSVQEKEEISHDIVFSEKRILLVEDETSLSDIQYGILTEEPCNHTVDVAENGQTAINLFDTKQYDFASLDYVLPGNVNGMAIYKHIRKTNKTIPVLFISGNIEFLEFIGKLKKMIHTWITFQNHAATKIISKG